MHSPPSPLPKFKKVFLSFYLPPSSNFVIGIRFIKDYLSLPIVSQSLELEYIALSLTSEIEDYLDQHISIVVLEAVKRLKNAMKEYKESFESALYPFQRYCMAGVIPMALILSLRISVDSIAVRTIYNSALILLPTLICLKGIDVEIRLFDVNLILMYKQIEEFDKKKMKIVMAIWHKNLIR